MLTAMDIQYSLKSRLLACFQLDFSLSPDVGPECAVRKEMTQSLLSELGKNHVFKMSHSQRDFLGE